MKINLTNATKSGLIRELGPERWQTLCALVALNTANPTQDELADYLGIRRETANRRIRSLCQFRWRDRPIIEKEQPRSTASNRFDNVRYRINTEVIFANE
jgi:DNA-binding MarR family transcriptional regulator